jgi:hypothetical protein
MLGYYGDGSKPSTVPDTTEGISRSIPKTSQGTHKISTINTVPLTQIKSQTVPTIIKINLKQYLVTNYSIFIINLIVLLSFELCCSSQLLVLCLPHTALIATKNRLVGAILVLVPSTAVISTPEHISSTNYLVPC